MGVSEGVWVPIPVTSSHTFPTPRLLHDFLHCVTSNSYKMLSFSSSHASIRLKHQLPHPPKQITSRTNYQINSLHGINYPRKEDQHTNSPEIIPTTELIKKSRHPSPTSPPATTIMSSPAHPSANEDLETVAHSLMGPPLTELLSQWIDKDEEIHVSRLPLIMLYIRPLTPYQAGQCKPRRLRQCTSIPAKQGRRSSVSFYGVSFM